LIRRITWVGPAGRLYAANTAGAALGSLAAGFVLIPALGLLGTTVTGVVATSMSILAALALARRIPAHEANATPTAVSAPVSDARPARRPKRAQPRGGAAPPTSAPAAARHSIAVAAIVLALTGLATFLFEVVWTRVFALLLGPSTYAFAAVLSSFIIGLALGALVGAALADRSRRPGIVLAVTLLATTLAAYVGIAQVGELQPAASTTADSALLDLALPGIALAFRLTLPIAVGLGVAFPLSLEVAGSRAPDPARRLGALYALNTAASVVARSSPDSSPFRRSGCERRS
jgi:spermidine synthase